MYEIEIYDATEEQLEEIASKLREQGLECTVEDGRFYALLPYYGQHVEAINELGFETDEDES